MWKNLEKFAMKDNRFDRLRVIMEVCRCNNKVSSPDCLYMTRLGFPLLKDTCLEFRRLGVTVFPKEVSAMIKHGDYPYKMLKLISYRWFCHEGL